MKKFIILIPLFNDWKSVTKLLNEIDFQINSWDAIVSVVIVNDASTEDRRGLEFNFKNTIKSVIGDEWHAGNLSYHLKSNPKWHSHSNAFVEKSVDDFIETIGKDGFIIVNGECPQGVLFIINNNNICMNGKK